MATTTVSPGSATVTAAGFTDVSVTFAYQVADGLHSAIVKSIKPPGATTAVAAARRELPVVQQPGCC